VARGKGQSPENPAKRLEEFDECGGDVYHGRKFRDEDAKDIGANV
jgi:hypothetical protein